MQGSMFQAGSGLKGALLKEVQDIDHRLRRDRESLATLTARIKTDEESRKLAVQFLDKLGEKAPEDDTSKKKERVERGPKRPTGKLIIGFLSSKVPASFSIPQIVAGIGWEENDSNQKAVYAALHTTLKPGGRVEVDTFGLWKFVK